jgi:hypothetical protein
LTFVVSAHFSAAATHTVPAGGDLQAALNAARAGDVIVLAAGATYTGNFRLPVTSGDRFITIRTGGGRQLPAAGTRIDPTHAPLLAKLQSPNTSAALATAPGAHHWRIELVEFLANAKGMGDIIRLGDGGSAQTDLAHLPRHLVLDRVYIHGDPAVGQKRGIALNSGYTEIVNSYIADIKSVGQDSQAIAGWNGSGPYLIENNYLEAAGENVLFGGADPKIWNLVPSDIVVRGNLMSKPVAWRTEKWQVKNAFELKNARRVLIEHNIFEHVWKAAQSGYAILFTTRNQDGDAPWSTVEDVTFRHNTVRHAGNAINILGRDDIHPRAQGARYTISDNLFYDIDGSAWRGAGIFLQIGGEPRDIVVERNTVFHTGNVIMAYGRRNGQPVVTDGFVFRDNLVRHNKYGVIGESAGIGRSTLNSFFTRLVFEGNVLAGGKASQYPANNHFPSVEEFEASFVDPAAGNFALVPGVSWPSVTRKP